MWSHIHLSKHVVLLLGLLLLHEVRLTSHWYAHSHARLLLGLRRLLVEHHALRLELWHLLLLRGLLHHWEASGTASLTLSLSHTATHHGTLLLLRHAKSTVTAHAAHATHSAILLLAPNAVKGVRILSIEQVRSSICLLGLKFSRTLLLQYLCLIRLHRIEIEECTTNHVTFLRSGLRRLLRLLLGLLLHHTQEIILVLLLCGRLLLWRC